MLPKPIPPPDRTNFEIPGPARVLILPDVHVPYQDNEALELALAYGKKWKPTHVLLNGDFLDCYAASSFVTNPKERDMAGELRAANEALEHLREQFGKRVPIIWKLGNHEERWDRYLMTRAPEMFGLLTTTLAAQFPDWVRFVPGKTRVMLGKLLLLHGHEYRFSISNPVSPARGIALRTKVSAMCSHFHQRSEHSTRDGHGRLLTTWSTGCLCHLQPDYLPMNEWSHGFATVEVSKDGAFNVDNLKILHGKVWTS